MRLKLFSFLDYYIKAFNSVLHMFRNGFPTTDPTILQRLDSIEAKIDKLCEKLNTHVDFIEERYSYYQSSLEFVKDRTEAILNSKTLQFFGMGSGSGDSNRESIRDKPEPTGDNLV